MWKFCTSCHIYKPLEMFTVARRLKDGHKYWCKECSYQHDKKYKMKWYIPRIPFTKEEYKIRVSIRMKEYLKEYQKTHKEDKNRNQKKYIKTENWRLNHILSEGKRRSQKNKTDNETIKNTTTMELFIKQDSKCNICWIKLNIDNRHLDHIIPISKWWPHIIWNVQRLCCKCNLSKSNKII